MDLKNTINNTKTQKENIKTVATNIDNKLIELGGERATDLADVVNKMDTMVGQYKKFAKGGKQRVTLENKDAYNDCKINMNLDFVPEIIICTTWKVNYLNESFFNGTTDSRYNKNDKERAPWNYSASFIKEGSITKKDFIISIVKTEYNEAVFDVEWIAIG